MRRFGIIRICQIRKRGAERKFCLDRLMQINFFLARSALSDTEMCRRVPGCANAVESGFCLEDVRRYV